MYSLLEYVPVTYSTVLTSCLFSLTGVMFDASQQLLSSQPAQPINAEDMKMAYAALGLPYNQNARQGAFLQQPLQQQGVYSFLCCC